MMLYTFKNMYKAVVSDLGSIKVQAPRKVVGSFVSGEGQLSRVGLRVAEERVRWKWPMCRMRSRDF